MTLFPTFEKTWLLALRSKRFAKAWSLEPRTVTCIDFCKWQYYQPHKFQTCSAGSCGADSPCVSLKNYCKLLQGSSKQNTAASAGQSYGRTAPSRYTWFIFVTCTAHPGFQDERKTFKALWPPTGAGNPQHTPHTPLQSFAKSPSKKDEPNNKHQNTLIKENALFSQTLSSVGRSASTSEPSACIHTLKSHVANTHRRKKGKWKPSDQPSHSRPCHPLESPADEVHIRRIYLYIYICIYV